MGPVPNVDPGGFAMHHLQPRKATRYEMERLRCNGCGEVFTAEEPAEAGAEKHDETAAAMIAQLRYGSGVPFQRLERLEANLGIPLPAATQWGVVEKAAQGIWWAYDEFIRQAALGEVMHNDDTGMRILRLAREPSDQRTGIFTSGIVSIGPGWKIALYFSGSKHAGENLAEVLKRRPLVGGAHQKDECRDRGNYRIRSIPMNTTTTEQPHTTAASDAAQKPKAARQSRPAAQSAMGRLPKPARPPRPPPPGNPPLGLRWRDP